MLSRVIQCQGRMSRRVDVSSGGPGPGAARRPKRTRMIPGRFSWAFRANVSLVALNGSALGWHVYFNRLCGGPKVEPPVDAIRDTPHALGTRPVAGAVRLRETQR